MPYNLDIVASGREASFVREVLAVSRLCRSGLHGPPPASGAEGYRFEPCRGYLTHKKLRQLSAVECIKLRTKPDATEK